MLKNLLERFINEPVILNAALRVKLVPCEL